MASALLIPRFLYTLFLFTKSDFKTIIIPTLFAVAAGPLCRVQRLPHVAFWVWLHILQEDVANQAISPAEDALNNPRRPIPSQRITVRQANALRWTLIPLCCAVSALYSRETVYASLAFATLSYLYNEGNGAAHMASRNLFNAVAFGVLEAGATLIAGPSARTMDRTAVFAVCFSVGTIATTIHAQDFKDVHGDRAVGRSTIPIAYPSFARYTLLAPMVGWAYVLAVAWHLDWATSAAFIALALYVGARFVVGADARVSYNWYNLWLSVANTLPGYYRLCRQMH
ncbi:UbiA prenyltransferase family [Amylostereum chailletii]|nr:UbiA prenyltransferase family [Amylostereum chailletii]